jgi:protein-glutamine gamma-glutamyltransferase
VAEGVKVIYHEMEVTLPKQGITSLARYDQKGEQLLSMKLAGMFEMRVEPEQLAKNTQFSGDLFELGKVKVDKQLGAGTTIASLILEVTGKQDLNLKSGPRQSVVRNESGTYTLKLGKAHGVSTRATSQEIEDHLAETVTYPISHAKIQALAREAVGDAQTAEEKVKRLVRFVSRYLAPSYTARPLTVMDVLKIRKGACSEYALLFTTLARAAGIPAREVGGLVYLGDDEKSFGFHAWNEVVLDNHWVPIDASSNETEINPTHISFGSVLGAQASNILLAVSSKLSFRVVEVRYRK